MLLFDDSKKLEKALGAEAAAVLAHVFEKADEQWRRDLATKADLMEVRLEIQAVRNDLIKWMVSGFVALGAFLLAAMALMK